MTDLFCMLGKGGPTSSSSGAETSAVLVENFSRLLRHLSLSSNCFLIGEESPGEIVAFQPLLEKICVFLQRNRFCQVNVRPVHPVRPGSADSWTEAYRTLLPVCRPFQEEGYRNQIVSRLRIFPILHVEDLPLLRELAPLLAFLNENFLLPSVLLPEKHGEGLTGLLQGGGSHSVERFYLCEGESFRNDKVLEVLYLTTMLERTMDGHQARRLDMEEGFCKGSLIVDRSGRARECIFGRFLSGEHLIPTSAAPECRGAGVASCRLCPDEPSPRSCSACMLQALQQAGPAFRLHMRSDEFVLVCGRLGDALIREGKFDEALRMWETIFRGGGFQDPPVEVLVKRALCYHAKGELERAMEELRKAREKDPGSPEIRYYMGLCEFGWKDYIEAADRFLEALELGLREPLRQDAEYRRGLSHYHLGEFDEALEALERAKKAGNRESALCFYLGLSWLGKGEAEQGLWHLIDALALGPSAEDLFHVLFYIAHAYKELGLFGDALDYLNRADSLQPESKEVANLKGFCCFKQKRYDEAIACFTRAIELDPHSAIDFANIGSCLRDQGDLEGARAMYQKALSLDPSIDFARENLERLADRH